MCLSIDLLAEVWPTITLLSILIKKINFVMLISLKKEKGNFLLLYTDSRQQS